MKNVVMCRRFESEKARLYELPKGILVAPGDILTVDYSAGSTATAFAVSNSYEVTDEEVAMIADLFHINDPMLDNLKKVRSVYSETTLQYPDEEPEEEDTEAEGEGEG